MNKKQNYFNHIRYYIPHHFIFYPIVGILFAVSVFRIFTSRTHEEEWIMIAAITLLVGWLSFMMRQHYALTNQNRTVRLELRFRYYRLTHESFEKIEDQLSFSQIAALRFAPDEELISLIRRTIDEGLSPSAIKQSIVNWTPDHMRV